MLWLAGIILAVIALEAIHYYRQQSKRRYLRSGPIRLEDLGVVSDFVVVRDAERSPARIARIETSPVSPTPHKRGAGYCLNQECMEFGKGVFLLNYGEDFYCPVCACLGIIMGEAGQFQNDSACIRSVRVEFDYDAGQERYRSLAMIWDPELPEAGTNTYELRSPLIHTKDRALKTAEALLASLQRVSDIGEFRDKIPRSPEFILDLDKSRADFQRECEQLGRELCGAEQRRRIPTHA